VQRIGVLDKNAAYDIIINLAGAPLNTQRWTKHVKALIYNSRIHTTQKVIDYIQAAVIKPQLLISGSAIGFYGNGHQAVFTESSPPADAGFTHRLCADWEKLALTAATCGTRVCTIRTGIVLGDGGVLAAMLPAYKWGLGAQLGNGLQWMSWVHIDDLVGMVHYLMTHPSLTGPVNMTAPHPVTHLTFSRHLAKALHRPCVLKLPPFLVRLIFGEMGDTLLLQGQKVLPEKITQAGYQFQFPHLDHALKNILSHP
jgi:uncharacterized protein (TIGR01777 family)